MQTNDFVVSVKDCGAVGDGVADDTSAIRQALVIGAGRTVIFGDPSVAYSVTGTLTVQANTSLVGRSPRTTKIRMDFDGDLMTLADGCSLSGLYLDGNARVGRAIVIAGTDSGQTVRNCKIANTDGNCIEFTATTAGSRSSWSDIETWQTNGATGSDKYAVVNADGVQATAVPKSFVHIETLGKCAFSFGGSNDWFVANSFLGDLKFSANSRSVEIVSTRIANQTALTVSGANHSIVGGDVLPTITLASGLTSTTIGPASFNTLPMIDLALSKSNLVTHGATSYTPTLASAGTVPSLGNGTITGTYSREGARISYVIELTLGTTTTLGTGQLQFGLPIARSSVDVIEAGQSVMNRGGTLYTGIAQIPNNVAYVTVARDTSGYATATSPATFASGDTIRIAGAYSL